QVRTEAPRVRYTTLERAPLVETAGQLQAQQADLQAAILELRDRIREAERGTLGSSALVGSLTAELDAARLAGGLVGLTGPGLVIQLEDAEGPAPEDQNLTDRRVNARDVRTVVEELWLAGAEAVSVNSERINGLSGFLDVGESILANASYLVPPYQVVAIGDAELYDRLTASAGFTEWVRERVQPYDLRVRYAEIPDAQVPAFAGAVQLRHTRPAPSPTATPAAGGGTPSVAP
ncbi:MAG: DUF881 domain-containing protein, partial [Chloroflexi bacterium]|nr:DUF881 domain-containing protein [Chloroflexota bacterium]